MNETQFDHIDRALNLLSSKRDFCDLRLRYYAGNHPKAWFNSDLKKIFKGSAQFAFDQNWSGLVVNAVTDRLDVEAVTITSDSGDIDGAADWVERIWSESDMACVQEEIHRDLAVCGEAFVMVDPHGRTADSDDVPMLYWCNPASICVVYDAERPKEISFAAKWWVEGKVTRLNLYYSDRIERYSVESKSEAGESDLKAQSFKPLGGDDSIVDHDFGRVPIFHFKRQLSGRSSELDDIVGIQDCINETICEMKVAMLFGAFPLRYVVSDADAKALSAEPAAINQLPEGSTMGQLTAFNPAGYLDVLNQLINAMCAIKQIPRYMLDKQGQPPSGESLSAQESPLVKKVKKYQRKETPVWQSLISFALQLVGHGNVRPCDITIEWGAAETVQPKTQADIEKVKADTRKACIDAGVPLTFHLKRNEGYSDSDIDALLMAQAAESGVEASLAEIMMGDVRDAAESEFNGGDGGRDRLNGAQITAASKILSEYTAGQIPREAVEELLAELGMSAERIKRMVDGCNVVG